MTDGATFRYGGLSFPLASAAGGDTLLLDADPALYWAMDFFATMLQQHVGARLANEAAACGATEITGAVAYKVPYDAGQRLATQQFKFPLLAVFRISDRYGRKTAAWSHEEGRWGVQYILPPLTDNQIEKLAPILHAAALALQNRTEQGHDPSYQSDARVWRDLAKLEQIGVVSAQFGYYEAQSGLLMPAWLGELAVSERMFTETGLDQFGGSDGTLDLGQSDGSATVPSFIQITQSNTQPIAWLDPRQVTQSGGVITAAANMAPGRSSFPWTPGAGTAPGAPIWSPTGFNGGPGFVWPGDHTRRLIAPIASSFAGTPPAAAVALTSIVAVQNGMANTGQFGVILETYRDADLVSSYEIVAEQSAGNYLLGMTRNDEAAVQDVLSAPASNAPCVLTKTFDGRTYVARINGVQVASSTSVTTGAMLAQDFVVVGGLSDAVIAAFGDAPFVGSMGQARLFAGTLTPAQLEREERAVADAAGIRLG